MKRLTKLRVGSFEKINKIHKPLTGLEQREGQNQQNYKWKGDIPTEITKTQSHKRPLWTTICQPTGQHRKKWKNS